MNHQAEPHSAEDYSIFVGKRVHTYLPKFGRYIARPATFHPGWNWAAFLFNFWWFLYRKMYLWAAICFASLCLPFPSLVIVIGWGVAANFLYFRHATNKITDLEAAHGVNYTLYLRDAGGVNGWVPWVALLVTGGMLILAMLGIIGLALLTASWSFWWFAPPASGIPI